MPALRLITFDLDNTLWDVGTVIRKAEAAMLDWIGNAAEDALANYTEDRLTEFRTQIAEEHSAKLHDLSFLRTEVLYRVMRATGYGERDARRLAEQAFAVFFDGRNRVEFFPGALELLEALQERYVLYALTNGNADIERTGLNRYMQGAISAADVGARKPDPAMFYAALEQTSTEPHETIHVGDHLIDDIAGAHEAGLHTVWVNLRGEEPEPRVRAPTQTVTDLADVESAVEQIANG